MSLHGWWSQQYSSKDDPKRRSPAPTRSPAPGCTNSFRRYETDGDAGLEPRSRRPRSNPSQTPRTVEDEIVALRKDLSDQGLDAGAATIAAHLHRRHGSSPSTATIWRVLTRRGFVTPQTAETAEVVADPLRSRPAQPTLAGRHHPLATGRRHLRRDPQHHRRPRPPRRRQPRAADLQSCRCRRRLRRRLLPLGATRQRPDRQWRGLHRPPARPRPGRARTPPAALGVKLIHSRAYHPQTCGKVERFHQTLKRWLAARDPATTLDQLQAQLDAFTDVYNTQRPHRALNRATPSEAWHARPRAAPTGDIAAPHYRVRCDVVNNGRVTLRHNSRLHHIGLGWAHNGTRVLILVADRHIRVITTDGELLRDFTLDPTRDYQPRGVKPGPKPRQT